jgi:hypothetical protein
MRGNSTRLAATLRRDNDGHGSHPTDDKHSGAAIAGYCPRNSGLIMKGDDDDRDDDDDDDDEGSSIFISILLLGDGRTLSKFLPRMIRKRVNEN